MPRLFGTDGIRGIANDQLTADLALRVGHALGQYLRDRRRAGPRVLIGRDTRRSGPMLQAAITAGLCATGAVPVDLGVVPTPALAWLLANGKAVSPAAAAIMISASHNPPEYNGIKIFGATGSKLDDEAEATIERFVWAGGSAPEPGEHPLAVGTPLADDAGTEAYLQFLRTQASPAPTGMHVVLDCAYGAMYRLAPSLFDSLGVRVTVINDRPDGANINRDCGATSPSAVAAAVLAAGAQVGFAFDGDGDRCIAVDERGSVVDGDAILAITALDRHERGLLPGPAVVATVMSNLGLERALKTAGIDLVRTKVGDRYVFEELHRRGLAIGGEQSGHVIFMDTGQTTGDGLLTAVQVLNVMARRQRPLSELAAVVRPLPQRIVNVPITGQQRAAALSAAPSVLAAIDRVKSYLGDRGRILVRPSGTEPVIRVMVEAEDDDMLEDALGTVVAALRATQGDDVE